jgi:murein peptide amidase A
MAEMIDVTAGSAGQEVAALRRMGRNHDGYHGETIDIWSVLEECADAAGRFGWETETIAAAPGLEFPTFTRKASRSYAGRGAVYISAGIHGDEPAGPLAVARLLRENAWPDDLDLWVCPCLNPTGFLANRRENESGTDLNRQYLQPRAKEIIAHIAWLERQPRFDMCLCLHEDWEAHGFYLYELNPDHLPSLAETIIGRVEGVCPVDHSEMIEGRAAKNGVIRPGPEHMTRTQWPEAFFLMMHKTRRSYTLEAPSDFPILPRVAALSTAVEAALSALPRAP